MKAPIVYSFSAGFGASELVGFLGLQALRLSGLEFAAMTSPELSRAECQVHN